MNKKQPEKENAFKLGPPIVLEDVEFRPLTINGMQFEPWQHENEVTGFISTGFVVNTKEKEHLETLHSKVISESGIPSHLFE